MFGTPVTEDITLVAEFECTPPPSADDPKLSDLKAVLASEDPASVYPIGTEIPDTYNGNDNPLIVAQYLDSSNNSKYGGAEGVILIRKFVEPTSRQFGSTSDYDSSTIKSFLESTYLNNSSEDIKSLISDIDIPYYWRSTSLRNIKSKWFIMSVTEVMGGGSLEGIAWRYWENRTGLTSPSTNSNDGRIVYNRSGVAQPIWLRTYQNATTDTYQINTAGTINYTSPTSSRGVLPACFVSKN